MVSRISSVTRVWQVLDRYSSVLPAFPLRKIFAPATILICMNMPTRRAFRPDGSFYRTTRRQRLTRSADGKLRLNPLTLLALLFAGLAAWGICLRFGGHGGLWTALLAYGSVVLCILSLGWRLSCDSNNPLSAVSSYSGDRVVRGESVQAALISWNAKPPGGRMCLAQKRPIRAATHLTRYNLLLCPLPRRS